MEFIFDEPKLTYSDRDKSLYKEKLELCCPIANKNLFFLKNHESDIIRNFVENIFLKEDEYCFHVDMKIDEYDGIKITVPVAGSEDSRTSPFPPLWVQSQLYKYDDSYFYGIKLNGYKKVFGITKKCHGSIENLVCFKNTKKFHRKSEDLVDYLLKDILKD